MNIQQLTNAINSLTQSLSNMANQVRNTVTNNATLQNSFNAIQNVAGNVRNAVNNFSASISGFIGRISPMINQLANGFNTLVKKVKSSVEKIVGLFGNLGNRFSSITKGIVSSIRRFVSVFNTALNNQFVKSAEGLYQSIYSLKNIVGHELTQQTIDWANSMERAFGLSARSLISDMNELSGVLYGLGMNEKHVAEGSQNIIMLSRYLASSGAAGGDATAVMNKILSGLKGSAETVDDLGFKLKVNDLDDYLESLKALGGEYENICTSFSKLNGEQQVYVRYSAIISQFNKNYDMTGFANALDTTTGRITLLKEALFNLKNTIGQALLETLGKIANFVTYVINIITSKIKALAEFFGLNMDFSANTNASSSAVDSLNNSLDSTESKIEDIEKASNKATKSLFGFDKVTKLNNNKSAGSGSGSGTDDFDYSKLFNSSLSGINDLASKSDSFMDRLKEKFEGLGDKLFEGLKTGTSKFEEWAGKKTGRFDYNLGFNWDKIKENLERIKNNIIQVISKWGTFALDIQLKFLDDINIGAIATEFTTLIATITTIANTLTDILVPAFNTFYDIAISPIVGWFGEKIVECIQLCNSELEKWNAWFKSNGQAIQKFFEDLAKVINAVWEVLEPILNLGWDVLGTTIETIGETIRKVFGTNDDGISKLGESFTRLQESLTRLSEALQNVWEILEPFREIGLIISQSLLGGVLTGGLELLCDLLDSVIIFLTGISDLITGIINLNPALVLSGILEIINGAWESLASVPTEIITTVLNVIGNFGNNIAEGFKDGLLEGWENIKSAILTPFTGFIDAIKEFFGIHSPSTVFAEIGRFLIDGLLNGITEAFGGLIEAVIGLVGNLVDSIKEAFNGFAEWFGEKFSSAKETATNAWNGVKEKFIEIKNNISSAFDSLKENIATKFTEAKNKAQETWQDIKEKFITIKDNAVHAFDNIKDNVAGKFREAKDKALEVWRNAKNEFKNIVDSISKVFDNIKTSVGNAFTSAKNGAIDIWNELTGQKTKARSVSINTPSTQSVQLTQFAGFRARGGVIPGGSAVIANEGGRLEMIGKVPGGQSVAVNNQMITSSIEKAVERAMSNALSRFNLNNGGGDIIIRNDGIAIYDEATLRTLKRKLAEID